MRQALPPHRFVAGTSRRRSEPVPLRPQFQRAGLRFFPPCCRVSIRATKTRRPRSQQRRPLRPKLLVSSRDASSFRHLGSGRREFLLVQPMNCIGRRCCEVRLGKYSVYAHPSHCRISAAALARRCHTLQRPLLSAIFITHLPFGFVLPNRRRSHIS